MTRHRVLLEDHGYPLIWQQEPEPLYVRIARAVAEFVVLVTLMAAIPVLILIFGS